jgi:acyl carrier protein
MTYDEVKQCVVQAIADEMGLPPADIREDDSFFNLGMDSVSCIFVMERIENKLALELNPIYFWDYPNVKSLSQFISTLKPAS